MDRSRAPEPGTSSRVGALIQARRRALGWSLQRLAESVGCAKGYLSEVENARRTVPGDEVLSRLEESLMLSAGDLVEPARWERSLSAGGQGVRRSLERWRDDAVAARQLASLLRAKGSDGRSALDRAYASGELRELVDRLSPPTEPPAPPAPRRAGIPLINGVAAGYPREFTDLSHPARHADEYVHCPDVEDPDAFAARVVGDSMSPDYHEGEIIVFSPARAPESGQDCFVRLEPDHESTFKRVYFERDELGREMIRLQPINSVYPPRVVPREFVAGLYVAVRAIRRLA